MEEAKGVLANESSHEIQTETVVYYFLDMWLPTAKISLFILRKGDTDPSWEMFLIRTLARFVVPPREFTEDALRFPDIRWKVPANSGANLYTET